MEHKSGQFVFSFPKKLVLNMKPKTYSISTLYCHAVHSKMDLLWYDAIK